MITKPSEGLLKAFEHLFEKALVARENAYAPYSNFKVGACVLSEKKKIYSGVNIEIKSYGLTLCAERNAIFSAIAKGEDRFLAIAIVADTLPLPCGACLEVMSEFFKPNAVVGVYGLKENEKRYYTFKSLLPHPFHLEEVK